MAKIQNEGSPVTLRPSRERGHANHGWLDSYHTFSFADYYDPKHMGFRTLRVINEDWIEPGMGFGTHPHKDMEILTYVVEGALKHQDSMGQKSVINAGAVQKITAGTGIKHSEFNASDSDAVHLLQIWILPQVKNLKPSYQEFSLPDHDRNNPLLLIGSAQGGKNVIRFHQDITVFKGSLAQQAKHVYQVVSGRAVWIQVIKGSIELNDHILSEGDGASIESVNLIRMAARKDSEFLLFDMK